MEISLLILFLLSCVYCCDMPAWKGFEFLINNHESLTYTIGVSIIGSYIFYVFQVIIPRSRRFWRTRNIAYDRMYHLEQTMKKMLCCLQDEPNRSVGFSKQAIADRLDNIDIFSENSKYEIQQGKELSVFEALIYYDNKIMSLADEIIAGQYLESKYEIFLLRVKKTKLHEKIMFWKNHPPGYYKRHNQELPGYNYVNLQVTNTDIVSSLDEYISLYKRIQKTNENMYSKLHSPLNEMINTF